MIRVEEPEECGIRSGRQRTNKSKSFSYAQKIQRYGLSKYLYDISYSSLFFTLCLVCVSAALRLGCVVVHLLHPFAFHCRSIYHLSPFDAVLFLHFTLPLPHLTRSRFFYLLPSNFSDSNLQQSENYVNTR